MPKKEKPLKTTKDFDKFLKAEMKRTKKSAGQIVEEVFGCGFVRYVEEVGKNEKLQFWSGVTTPSAKAKKIAEYRELRKNFTPVSQCIDYLKSVMLGSDIDAQIDEPKDENQVKIKEHTQKFIRAVRQDVYTRGMFTLMSILLDEALTTGNAGAEIVYESDPKFDDYVNAENAVTLSNKKKGKAKKEWVIYTEVAEPQWKDSDDDETKKGLGGITRLKIIRDSGNRLARYREPLSWEIQYWTLDETAGALTFEDEIRGKTSSKTKKQVIKYHPWQLFWLAPNRREWDIFGESVIAPVCSIAKTLRRIIDAVGEGIYRAGNKKFFIVTGTEKRPWSSPHIRDVMSQIKEMGEKNWTTVPVPAGFDIKDIGGEVFEATNVINTLLTLIAHGMNCPKEIVGLPSRGSGERQFISSNIEVERMRNVFKFAVEDQLFARHIWCEYGKVRTKQSGRSHEPTYIPMVKTTTKGLMSDLERLELCLKLLNVANPLDPRTKYRAEKEILQIMGWDDVPLPTMEEIEDEIKKQKAEQAKLLKQKEKAQGEPDPQTKERQEKRLKGMEKSSAKGQSKEMGTTRTPKDVAETVKQPEKPSKVELDITVKSKPQRIVHETQVTVKTPLDGLMKTLGEQELDMKNRQKIYAEIDDKRKGRKQKKEIKALELKIEETKAQIEAEKAKTEKAKTETEEIKKTHEKKRQVATKIEEQIETEEQIIKKEGD
jgi:hypothetical protein